MRSSPPGANTRPRVPPPWSSHGHSRAAALELRRWAALPAEQARAPACRWPGELVLRRCGATPLAGGCRGARGGSQSSRVGGAMWRGSSRRSAQATISMSAGMRKQRKPSTTGCDRSAPSSASPTMGVRQAGKRVSGRGDEWTGPLLRDRGSDFNRNM